MSEALQKIEPMPADMAVESRHAGPLDMEPVAFRAGLDRRKENRQSLMEWIRSALVENVDYGRIQTKRGPSKPSLFKPGAEKICGMLGIITTFPTLTEYEQAALKGIEIKSVVLRCALLDSRGIIVAEGVGARSLAQDYGDLNKALKMSEKSAHIDATLRMAGLSEVFTQDLEDLPPRANVEAERKPVTSKATQKPTKPTQATEPASEDQRVRWVKQLKTIEAKAEAYGYEHGILIPPSGPDNDQTPGEPVECWPLSHTPTTKAQAERMFAEIQAFGVDENTQNAGMPVSSDENPVPVTSDEQTGSEAPEGSQDYPRGAGVEPEQSDDGVETITGKLEAVSVKEGKTSNGKKWTKYGLKINGEWINSFSNTLGKLAQQDKGSMVRVQFKRGDKGCDLVGIERANPA